MVASIVVEYLRKGCEVGGAFLEGMKVGIAVAYCIYKEQERQTPTALLSSLLSQLALDLPEISSSLLKRHKNEPGNKRAQLSSNEVVYVLRTTLRCYHRTYIVIDAIDQCRAGSTREILLSTLLALQDSFDIRLLITGRPHLALDALSHAQTLEVCAPKQDSCRYLKGRMLELPAIVRDSCSLQERISSHIANLAEGMFLLAQLHMASLSDKLTEADIDNALGEMQGSSDGLRQAYSYVLSRIENSPPGNRQLARKVLLWVVHARRSLTPDELRHALAITPQSHTLNTRRLNAISDILSCCVGLVVLDRTSNDVRLVHHTAQEYFQSFGSSFFGDGKKTCLASDCLIYLSYDTFSEHTADDHDIITALLRDLPFLSYAALHWAGHFRDQEPTLKVTLGFLHDIHKTTRSFQVLWSIRRIKWMFPGHKFPDEVYGIHLVCYFGMASLLQKLLESAAVDTVTSAGRTPLSYAAEQGHATVARALINHAAALDIRDSQGYPPLAYAATYGHASVLKLLINHGALACAEYPHGTTGLFLAISNNNEEAIKVLLESGAGTITKEPMGELQVWSISLTDAAFYDHVMVAQFLLDNNAEPNFRGLEGRTPLSHAAGNRHIAIVELLIRHGAQIDLASRYSRTPLSYAAEKGHVAIVRILLDNCAMVDGDQRNCRETPLEYAIKGGHVSVAQALIEGRANIHAENSDGQTPLLTAASAGLDPITELLICKGASVSHTDIWGLGALSYAAAKGHETAVRLQIRNGAQVNQKDSGGHSALYYAITWEHHGIVQLLLESGAVSDPDWDVDFSRLAIRSW